jgi:hypothetical protein
MGKILPETEVLRGDVVLLAVRLLTCFSVERRRRIAFPA